MHHSKLRKLVEIRQKIWDLQQGMQEFVSKNKELLQKVIPNNVASAQNFLHYLFLRQKSLKDLQLELSELGLSSLSHSEGHALHNIIQIRERLDDTIALHGRTPNKSSHVPLLATKKSGQSDHSPPIFVGRKDAESLLHRNTQLVFGALPRPRHIRFMVTCPDQETASLDWLKSCLEAGMDCLRINCAHGDKLEWQTVINRLSEAKQLTHRKCKILMDLAGQKLRIVALSNGAKEKSRLRIQLGEELLLCSNETINIFSGKNIVCSNPEVFQFLMLGHRVFFDDGKVECRIVQLKKNVAFLQVIRCEKEGFKLKLEKGINFPDSTLTLPTLTEKDLADLEFAKKHSNLIGLSFVQDESNVEQIQFALKDYPKIEIVYKIETVAGFNNFPKIMLKALQREGVAVMIARGDLAIECGFNRLAEVQEELLWLCEAAHIPVIWATQILENFAKTGFASRAEVTDAAMSVRAEVVMLNKGDYIVETLEMLNDIIYKMEAHQYKKRSIYRELKISHLFLT